MTATTLPTLHPHDVPADQLAALSAALKQGHGKALELPDKLREFLREVVADLSAGQRVLAVADEAYLTTTQAAAVMGVSRSYVARLVRDGRLAAEKVGTHHRIPAAEAVRARERRAALEQVIAAGEDLELMLEGRG